MMKYGPVALFTAADWTPTHSSLPGIAVWKHVNVKQQRSGWEQFNKRLWWLDAYRHPDADWAYAKAGAEALATLMQEFQPDCVVLEEVWLYPYLKTLRNFPALIIFDNLNVEFSLWEQNFRSVRGIKARSKARLLLSHLQTIERDLTQKVQQIWVCSDEDAVLLHQLYSPLTPIATVPNGIDVSNYAAVRAGQCALPAGLESGGPNLLFLGQMSYAPNTVAAHLLLDEIYPRIKQRHPNLRLLLVGRTPTQRMKDAAQQDTDIMVTGAVPDVKPYLAASQVMVVPLREGSGTRFKILEAFAAGCPVISTAKGAEGLKVVDGVHLLIRDDIEDMVSALDTLLANPALGQKLAQAAYDLVEQEYSWNAVGMRVNQLISQGS
ncbi:MAG: glycosyltransferase family 4 protein [Leptolyngbyaceae cyanobacterium bins.59]|nr:glycosyltransferase family 4 protein [Leptolyngbyaceae cyanobacterium bins.59]